MTQSILRIALTTMALVMLFAGSLNLNRTSAQEEFAVESGGGACQTYCGCAGGPNDCCRIEYPNGSRVYCGMP